MTKANLHYESDQREWIKWAGGDRPVTYHTTVCVRLRDYGELTDIAGAIIWDYGNVSPGDVVEYCVVGADPSAVDASAELITALRKIAAFQPMDGISFGALEYNLVGLHAADIAKDALAKVGAA